MEKEIKQGEALYIKKTTVEEIPAVMEILAEGSRALAAAGVDQWNDGYPAEADVRADVARGVGYSVLIDGRVVGTAVILADGESDYDVITEGKWLTDGPYLTVHRIATAPSEKRRGVASFLMASAAEMARACGMRSIRIDTHADNLVMQSFLSRNGFVRCGVIHLGRNGAPRYAYEKLL